jgi:hypothetical protein
MAQSPTLNILSKIIFLFCFSSLQAITHTYKDVCSCFDWFRLMTTQRTDDVTHTRCLQLLCCQQQAPDVKTTAYIVDGANVLSVCDGNGGLSVGASTRCSWITLNFFFIALNFFLLHCPELQKRRHLLLLSEVLDYLFKPKFRASVAVCRLKSEAICRARTAQRPCTCEIPSDGRWGGSV